MIYFIGESWDDPVKIGYTHNVEKRLVMLQTGNPYKLYILYKLDGDRDAEKRLHKMMRLSRVRGEWFNGFMCKRLVDYFEDLGFEETMIEFENGYLYDINSIINEEDPYA